MILHMDEPLKPDSESIRAFLSKQDKSILVDLLLDQSQNDDRLHEKLTMKAAKTERAGPDLVAFRKVINSAVKRRRFIDYAHAYEYSQGIEQIIDLFSSCLVKFNGHSPLRLDHRNNPLHPSIGRSISRQLDSLSGRSRKSQNPKLRRHIVGNLQEHRARNRDGG